MIRLISLTVTVALAVAACTSTAGDSTTTTDAVPATTTSSVVTATTLPPSTTTTTEPPDGFGGEVRIGVDFPIETLNPFAPDAFGVHTYGNLAWATMYDIDPDTWDRMPEVVEAVSSKSDGITVNDDGTMTVTYKLIDEARWSEGKPITGFTLAFTTANDATARFSEIVDAARTAVDPVEFLDLVREAESILAAELPVIPLFSRGTGLAIWPDAVTGVISNGSRSDFTWNIELWQSPGQ